MGKIQKEIPVKLICGFIFSNNELFEKTKAVLSKKFGRIDFESESLIFNYTNYYEGELGKGLMRSFISFERLILPHRLASVKIYTNKLESRFLTDVRRCINIDPGYVNGAKLVLATTKDYSHRIYLSKGIFGEITLVFKGDSFTPWQWTYPDYKIESYIKIFNHIRLNYLKQLKENV